MATTMSSLHDLPKHVFAMIESGVVAEFSTVTAAGVPIDTPTYYFPADDSSGSEPDTWQTPQ
jgi:hypothetical protein